MSFATRDTREERERVPYGSSEKDSYKEDAEIERLEKELRESRLRERAARADVREAHKRFELLRSTGKSFAASMRESAAERHRSRQRIAAQYAVGRVLADAGELEDAAANTLPILVGDLGWSLGVFWCLEGDVLRCRHLWAPSRDGREIFEEACRGLSLRRGEGLPGKTWAGGKPVWVENVSQSGDSPGRRAAEAAGLRSAVAFPVRDGGRTSGVFELFGEGVAPPDEELLRVASAIGGQIGQFAERRRAEKERERLLARERAARSAAETARQEATAILESISDAFISYDRNWRFVYTNGTAADFLRKLGKDPDDLLGKVVWREFPEILGTKLETEVRRAVREGIILEYEEYFPPLDVWLGVRAYPSDGGVSTYIRDVTERKRAEEALKRNEERWRALIDKGADVITISDRDGTVRFVSPSVEAVCGYTVEEFVGSDPFELGYIHPDDLGRCGAVLREMATHPGHSVTVQHRYRHKSEGWRWLEGTFTSLFHDPAIGGLVANFRDVTERKRMEDVLRESEERLRRAIEIETVGVVFFDTEGAITGANDAFLRMSGYDREDLGRGMLRWDTMTPPEYMPRSLRAIEELRTTGRTTPYEKEYTRKDGSRWWALFAAKLLDGEEGVEYVVDVTERRRAEEALREGEEWLRLAQRAARSGTWEWDLGNGEIRWSAEHRELFGFAPSDEPIEREDWWDAIHPDDLPRIEEAGRRCSEEGEEWPEIEYRISCGGEGAETRWIDARGRTVRDDRGRPVRILGTSVDVTERKRAEEERDRLLAQEWVASAEVAERERISRELHDRVAHSMAVVHQSLQLHEIFKESNPSQAAAKMAMAREMAKTALESTRNLSMELRRSEAEEGLVPALQDLLKVAVPPGIRADLRAEGDESRVPPHVRGQLFAVLREGVRNAVAHSGATHVRVGLDIAPNEAVCSVEDDGRGLPKENGENGDGASGVGLRSMRERAGLLGGDFRLSSSPGEGTRVEVTVPLNGGR